MCGIYAKLSVDNAQKCMIMTSASEMLLETSPFVNLTIRRKSSASIEQPVFEKYNFTIPSFT